VIPVRVLLKNFLCYAEGDHGQPIEFDFEGSPLWSVSGDNGAGKSAIFDAITYTLFGKHRGGAQEDSRLIRKGADRCEAAFEFRLNGKLYRVRRTVSRPKGKARQEPKTWQAAEFDSDINDWRPIKETERATYFDRWVQDKLGLRYETFVASITLLQGQSDQLITALPKKRFEILSGLLDLDPYKRLEAAANDRMRDARRQVEELEKKLALFPAVTQRDIEQAQAEAQRSETAFTQAQQAIAHAQVLVNEAARFAKLQKDLAAAQNELTEKDNILRGAERIRSEYQEWKRITVALPKLRDAVKDLQEANERTTQSHQKQFQAATVDVETFKHVADATAEAEQQVEEQLAILRSRAETLSEMLPLLREVFTCRREQEIRKQQLDKQGIPQHWEAEVARLRMILQDRQQEKERAATERDRIVKDKARAQAALEQAQRLLAARLAAQNEAVCSRCGQPVNPEHIQREREDAEQAVRTARRQEETATFALQTAEHAVRNYTTAAEEINRQLQQACQSLTVAKQAETEWQDARAKLQHVLQVAAHVPADLLSVVSSKPLSDAQAAVQSLDTESRRLKAQLVRAEEDKKQASRNKSKAQNDYQQALRDRERLQAEAKRLEDGALALRQQAEVRLADVDPHWRERVLDGDFTFVKGLEKQQTVLAEIEQQHATLQQAALERERLTMRVEEIKRNLESLQPEYRIPEREARLKAEQARKFLQESQDHRDKSLEVFRNLKGKQTERQQLERDAAEAQRQRRLYARLADLLGRNGLQSHLLDEVVQGIARLANETLSRISGGQLQLQIQKQEEEIAIQVKDLAFSEEPLDAQFLSGSQKFRVSVALAAGIGQYMGHGAGSVRALIIDEGFGSLDTQGRQEMIDELRNLSQFMDRIIIVSHQEDFQDRTLFPTGYVLRKVNQRTQVERFV
jgi:exonuclease SbcC